MKNQRSDFARAKDTPSCAVLLFHLFQTTRHHSSVQFSSVQRSRVKLNNSHCGRERGSGVSYFLKMEEDSIHIPDELVLHDVADLITEAMLLLDPTAVSGTFLLSLSSTPLDDVTRAHSMLISASQKVLDIMKCYESKDLPRDEGDETDDLAVNQLVYDTISTIADLYRSLIVSSYLQLFHAFSSNTRLTSPSIPSDTPSEYDANANLCRTIQRCIALLYSLSLIVRQSALSCFKGRDINTCRDKGTKCKAAEDWHDDYLPTPQYGLLQDCFLRKDRVCLEDGTVFGKDEREISLDSEKYERNHHLQSQIMNYKEKMRINQDISRSDYSKAPQYLEDPAVHDDTMDIFNGFPMNAEQLEQEENILLEVAFPKTVQRSFLQRGASKDMFHSKMSDHTMNRSFGITTSKKKRKWMNANYSGMAHETCIQMARKFGVGKFLWNQFMYGPVAIRKRSWLRFHRTKISEEKAVLERTYCVLYASGLLLSFKDESLSEAVSAYEISHESICEPIIDESILRFKIGNVDMYELNNRKDHIERKINILIDLDDGSEDILSQVYSWVTELSQLVEFAVEKKKHRAMIHSLWM